MFEPKKILVPTDFSDYSDKALTQALELAKQYKAKINLLHVVHPISACAADYCPDEAVLQNAENNLLDAAKKRMQDELTKCDGTKGIDVTSDVREGPPAEEILREQEEQGIDLIVMSSHGKTGFIKRLIGTVSEKVMEEAKCSVLLVRS